MSKNKKNSKSDKIPFIKMDMDEYFESVDKKKSWLFKNPNTNQQIEFVIHDRSLQNRYKYIFKGLLHILFSTNSFDEYYQMIYEYANNTKENEFGDKVKDVDIWFNHINFFNDMAEKYIKIRNIDFSRFSQKKKKKNSIFFEIEDINEIYKLSILFKLFFFGYSTNHKLSNKNIKKIMYIFTKKAIDTGIFSKINDIIRIKMLQYKLSDGKMIERISRNTNTSFDIYFLYIFNLVTNYIIIGYDLTNNPINYFIGAINNSLDWFLRTIYTNNIVYYDIDKEGPDEEDELLKKDIFSNDIEMSSLDFIKNTYYKDNTNKIIIYVYNWLEQKTNKFNINLLNNVLERTKVGKHNFIMEQLFYSFLEKVINVKNKYFSHLFVKDQYMIQIFIAILLQKSELVDKKIINFLFYAPMDYFNYSNNFKCKNFDIFTDDTDNYINKVILYKFISNLSKYMSGTFFNLLNNDTKTFINDMYLQKQLVKFAKQLLNDEFDWKKIKSIFYELINEIEYESSIKNILYTNKEDSQEILEYFYI